MHRQHLGQARPAFHQRALAPVLAGMLQQVVGQHPDRGGRQRLRARLAALDAGLQCGERLRLVGLALPGQQLAVDHAVGRKRGGGGLDLGKPPVQPLLAARPQRHLAVAPDQLQPDAVPLPLQQPLADSAQRRGVLLKRRGQEERVRLLAVAGQLVGRKQLRQEPRRRLPFAQHALRDPGDVHTRHLRQRLLHGALGHADAQRARQQLVERQALVEAEHAPARQHRLAPHLGRAAGHRQQGVLDPVVQRAIVLQRRVIQQQRHGFGKIADVVVAVLHQPGRMAAGLLDPLPQFAAAGNAPQLAARQQPQRPGRVLWRSVAEIGDQRGTLVERACGLAQFAVERGETLHDSSP